ncbi:MAG TPA: hypothetical protein VJL28_11900 [Gemmatimonadaceae bacterium]|nr:hypothetical protein [Gemmatimonadaceae bacterium]
MRRAQSSFALTLAFALAVEPLGAQVTPPPDTANRQADALRVFLDCDTSGCDEDFFITEIPFVNFTRDRTFGDIHLLVTSLATGAGGSQYTVKFIGQRRFAGLADTVVTSVPPNTTSDGRRRELARVFKLGLIRYVATTPLAGRLRVVYDAPSGARGQSPALVKDPWNFWVFRISANGNLNGQSLSTSDRVSGSLSARRITNDWKVVFSGSGSNRRTKYTFEDGSSSEYSLRSYSTSSRVVKSLDAHWSAGVNAEAGQSDYSNQKLYVRGSLSAEYNFFPWSKATEKQFVAIYALGAQHYRYQEQTIYFLDRETRPNHQFVLALTTRQPWGSLEVQGRASQYLHDGSKQNLSISGWTDVRLSRGLSVNLFAYASRVRDQLYIAAGSLTRDEVLTQQRALATSYDYGVSVGISYTFGSLYSVIVNPRLDNLGGGGSFFFF